MIKSSVGTENYTLFEQGIADIGKRNDGKDININLVGSNAEFTIPFKDLVTPATADIDAAIAAILDIVNP